MSIPTTPVGQPGALTTSWQPGAGAGWAAGTWEQNPELRETDAILVYDRMRRTDPQTGAVMRAVTLPIRKTAWRLDSDGVDPAIAAFVADQINLDAGQHLPGGLDWPDHLRQLLLALAWGYAPFEISYVIEPGRTPGAPETVAAIGRLGLRPPITISEIRTTADGDLAGIFQLPAGVDSVIAGGRGGRSAASTSDRWLAAPRLAFYSLDREGADWRGVSILRTAYKPWLLKESSLLAAAQGVERNSMGLPVVEYLNDEDRDLALAIATAARAGSTAGIAIPMDRMRFSLVGVTGTVKDPVPLIRYFDEQIAIAALAMFLTLGHDAGARSLGDTFAKIFAQSLNATAEWAGVETTKQIIRPLVDLNFGPGQPIPVLTPAMITEQSEVTAEAIAQLVNAGVLTPDGELEDHLRLTHGLPARADPGTGPVDATPTEATEPGEAALSQRLHALAARLDELRSP